MENLIEVITPSGYKVYVKSFLSFGDYQKFQSVILSGTNIEADSADTQSLRISGDKLIEANQKAMELLIIKAIDPNGVLIENPVQKVLDLPYEDGAVVMEQINEITQKTNIGKKKETVSS